MRDRFVKEITKLAETNKKIVILAGDIGYKLFDNFIKKFPKRFYNCGVAEMNMTTTAAGLAIKGFLPITYTIATFNVYKTVEQIKLDVCYLNKKVIIVGVGSGLGYADLGATHHSTEDIAVLRSIPNLNIICPADPLELASLLPQILKNKNSTYLRLGKKGEKNVYKSLPKTKLGQPQFVLDGKKICIISTGNIITEAKEAIKNLKKKKLKPALVSLHTIKPINEKFIEKIFRKFKYIVTLEEHSKIGGLASAISEIYVSGNKFNNKFLPLNTGEKFLEKSGRQKFALKKLKISSLHIEKKIINFIKKR